MMHRLWSYYGPSYQSSVVYMLQSVEYQVAPFLSWYWRTQDFSSVMHRRTLNKTVAASRLLIVLRFGIWLQMVLGIGLSLYSFVNGTWQGVFMGAVLSASAPVIWAHLIILPLLAGQILIVTPRQKQMIEKSKEIFQNHPGTIIAVAGSYGKTTMKELLLTVLSEGKKVAATPANKNVAVSHAKFAAQLEGDEDILILEYGEGRAGDVLAFAQTTRPDIGIITGIAPAHLDQYSSLEAAANDIFSLADHLDNKNVYVNAEASSTHAYIKPAHVTYSANAVGDWSIKNIRVTYTGTQFVLSKGEQKLKLSTQLVGIHQVGPLAVVAVLGLQFGLSPEQIENGVKKTTPHEHRMQPRKLGGGWIIDDTYNGNIEGIRAGLELLTMLPAKRKVYVTPGLVDQGAETVAVHGEIGRLIAKANPDKVVLMQNSVTKYIQEELQARGYSGELQIEHDPLTFYSNLEHIIAAGDLIVMQNDWTDNYS